MAFCPNCGTPATPDTRFCQRCGTTISSAPAAPPPRPPSYGAPQPPPQQPGAYYPLQPAPPQQPPPQAGGYYQPQAPQYPQPVAYPTPAARSQSATWKGGAILAAGGVIAILVYTGVISFSSGPKKAVEEARSAYNRKDLPTFEKYVDLNSVVSSGLDQLVAGGQVQPMPPQTKMLIVPQISDVVKNVFFGKPITVATPQVVAAFTPMMAQLQELIKKLSYQGVQDEKRNGTDATINVKLIDKTTPNANPMLLTLQLQDKGSNWQITAALNIMQLK